MRVIRLNTTPMYITPGMLKTIPSETNHHAYTCDLSHVLHLSALIYSLYSTEKENARHFNHCDFVLFYVLRKFGRMFVLDRQ